MAYAEYVWSHFCIYMEPYVVFIEISHLFTAQK